MARTPTPLRRGARRAPDPAAHTWLELGEAQRLLIDPLDRLALGLTLDGRVQWVNPEGARLLGSAVGDLVGRQIAGDLIDTPQLNTRAQVLSAELGRRVAPDAEVLAARLRDGLAEEHAWTLQGPAGQRLPVRLRVGTLRDPRGVVTGLLAVDIGKPSEATAPTPALARHDPLTGLPDRSLLSDRAEMAIQHAARAGARLALLLVELQGYEALCQRLGRSVGEDLLRATAGRLHFELRKTDTAVRWEGGQFVALLVDIQQPEQARQVAAKIAAALAGPVNTGVELLQPSARVGVAVYPEQGDQLLPLLQAAEADLAAGAPG